MTETLKKVIAGQISFQELVEWLCPKDVQDERERDPRFTELRAEFAISFLNHLRDCSAWLVPSAYVDSTNSRHNVEKFAGETRENIDPNNHVKKVNSSTKKAGNGRKKTRAVISLIVGCESYEIQKKNLRSDRKKQISSRSFENKSTVLQKKNPPNFNDVNSFPQIVDADLLQRRIEPKSSQLKSLTVQPFPQPSLENLSARNCSTYVIPHVASLKNKKKLYLFENIYDALFSYGLVPNVSSELYFLFQLLISAVKDKSVVHGDHALSTIHNCAHFAVSALYNQRCLLTLLDKGTLTLLCDIPYLKEFSVQFREFVKVHVVEKSVVRVKKKTCIDGVPFREDTDTSPNFPSNESFCSFSKQRDLFYDILREWEEKYPNFDTYFENWFLKKVRLLMDLGAEMINYFHLARLFYEQLLVSCLHAAETLDGYDKSLLSGMNKSWQSLKLFRRLSSFVQSDGYLTPPAFHGPQAFFEAFLIVASSAPLNEHLLNIFSSQIVDLNNPDNFSEIENRSLEEIHEKFSTTVHTLRLLAKFYGFIIFLSHRPPKPMPKWLLNNQKAIRQYSLPPLDFGKILNVAVQKHSLVLTVPWIVELLSMMDQVTPTLDYYLAVCKTLVKIYRGCFKKCMNYKNFEFVRLVIGYLIETPNFPMECLFYIYSYSTEDIVEASENDLDFQDVIDTQLVYSCCPYLADLKSLISDFLNGVKKSSPELSKIFSKPSTLWQDTDRLTSEQSLEMQMEENFFFSHPVILKQTADFVAERITSRIVHRISKKMDELKVNACDNLISYLKEHSIKDLSDISLLVAEESKKLCQMAEKWASTWLKEDCVSEIKQVLPQLLSEEFDVEILEMACRIASRMTIKKLADWMDNNVLPEKVKNYIRNRVQKLSKEGDNLMSHFDEEEIPSLERMNAQLPYNYIRLLQKIVLELHSKPEAFSVKKLLCIFDSISIAIDENYLPPYVIEAIILLATDVAISLIVYFPQKFSVEVVRSAIKLFLSCHPKFISTASFLNARILYLMSQYPSPSSWKRLTFFFEAVIQSELISVEELNVSVLNLVHYKWTKEVLYHFKTFLSNLARLCAQKTENIAVFSSMVQAVNNFKVSR